MTVGFGFFFFSFLGVSESSLSRFADFFFGGVVSPFTLSAIGQRQIEKRRGRIYIPSSCFRFLLLGGMTAISPFGTLFPLPFTLSFSFATILPVSFALPQDSKCSFTACRMIGLEHFGQEIRSGDSFMGIFPNVNRSCGSSCFATGDPKSELGGDWFPCDPTS